MANLCPKTFNELDNFINTYVADMATMEEYFKNQSEEITKWFFESQANIPKLEKIHTRLNGIKYFIGKLNRDLEILGQFLQKLDEMSKPALPYLDNCTCQVDENREFYKIAEEFFNEFQTNFCKFSNAFRECAKHDRDLVKYKPEGFARVMMKQLTKMYDVEEKLVKLNSKINDVEVAFAYQKKMSNIKKLCSECLPKTMAKVNKKC